MDIEKREEFKPGIMGETFLSHYIQTYHYFNFNGAEQEYVDVTYEQYDPATPVYIGGKTPPGVSDVRQVLLTEGDRMKPNTREIIKEICSER